MKSKAKKLTDLDFCYVDGVKYTYDTHQNNCNCPEDDYHRCTEIENVSIKITSLHECVLKISNFFDMISIIDQYAVDRICRIHKLYDESSWDGRVTGGYYGEEFEGVFINPATALAIERDINAVKAMPCVNSTKEKIEYILKLEYDYLLPVLEDCDWKLVPVATEDITKYQEMHKKSFKNTTFLMDYNLPVCVLLDTGNGYRIIDGYHRLAHFSGCDMVLVFVGTPKKGNDV
jgi:hypothetical protein